MGLFDRIARRRSGQEAGPTAGTHTSGTRRTPREAAAEALALDRYERMLSSAPPATVERVHADAFERLTPAERDAVFERLAAGAASADERPADATPAGLARSASSAESRRSGAVARLLGTDPTGAALNAAVGAAILGAVASYAAGSAVWAAWAAEGDEDSDGYGGTGGGIGGFDF